MVDKELLQILVTVVDAQLLKGVLLKGLKSKDVQYTDRETLLARRFLDVNGASMIIIIIIDEMRRCY